MSVTTAGFTHATLKEYLGGPHGLADTHKDQLNADLLDFVRRVLPLAGKAAAAVR